MAPLPDAVWLAVAALGRATGLDPLVLDDEGELVLDIGSGLALQLASEPEHQALLLFGVPGSLRWPADPAQLVALLQANFAWRDTAGASLSLDGQEPPQLVLARRLPWATLSDSTLVEAYREMSEVLWSIHDWLDAEVAPFARPSGEFPAEGLPGAFGPGWGKLA